jgi:hypothetical protein
MFALRIVVTEYVLLKNQELSREAGYCSRRGEDVYQQHRVLALMPPPTFHTMRTGAEGTLIFLA